MNIASFMQRNEKPSGTVTIKHEYKKGALKQGAVTCSTLSYDNPATMRGLERMFALRGDETIVAVTFNEHGITVVTEKGELTAVVCKG